MKAHRPSIQIMPSLLAADIGRLAEEARRAESAGADLLHLDIMDGHFVRNISFGPEVVRMAKKAVRIPLSVHLMLSRPDEYVDAYADAGSDLLLIHVEAPCDVAATLRAIRGRGIRAGVTLNPETPADFAFRYLDAGLVDEVLFMTVHPGFGGQSFIPGAAEKMSVLRRRHPGLDISVDGGIDLKTIGVAAGLGANAFVAGTSLYKAADMAGDIAKMRALAETSRGPEGVR